MKICLYFVLLISFLFPFSVFAIDDLVSNSKSSVLIDYDTGEVIYDKNMNERRSVASLTKMMGLLIIMEEIKSGSLKTDEILTVSKTAMDMGGTQIWLSEGEKISVDDLLKGITLASANDAMVLMAERISGTELRFVEEMNRKVKDLGLKNTHFTNCTGFDEDNNYSSAYDMAIIAKELIKYPKILDYTSKYEDYIRENTDNRTWIVNTNKLVKFYKGVDGLKTGYEDRAGSTICVTAKKDNLRLIGVSLGYLNTKDRNSETMKLLDYGFNQYESKVLFRKGNVLKKVKVNKSNNPINLILKDDVSFLNKKGGNNIKYSYDIKLDNISFPINKKDRIGYLYLKKDNKVVSKYNLYSDKKVGKISIFKLYFKTLNDALRGSF